MQNETALYGAKMMQPGMTAADSEENNLRPQHLEDYIGQEKVKQNLKTVSYTHLQNDRLCEERFALQYI